jgi:hypothetical protein
MAVAILIVWLIVKPIVIPAVYYTPLLLKDSSAIAG